jgi:hypothetical protein
MTDTSTALTKKYLEELVKASGLPAERITDIVMEIRGARSHTRLIEIHKAFLAEMRNVRLDALKPQVCDLLRRLLAVDEAELKGCLSEAAAADLVQYLTQARFAEWAKFKDAISNIAPQLPAAEEAFTDNIKTLLAQHLKSIGQNGAADEDWNIENDPTYQKMRRAASVALGSRLHAEIERIVDEAIKIVDMDPARATVEIKQSLNVIGRSLCQWPDAAAVATKETIKLLDRLNAPNHLVLPLQFD